MGGEIAHRAQRGAGEATWEGNWEPSELGGDGLLMEMKIPRKMPCSRLEPARVWVGGFVVVVFFFRLNQLKCVLFASH